MTSLLVTMTWLRDETGSLLRRQRYVIANSSLRIDDACATNRHAQASSFVLLAPDRFEAFGRALFDLRHGIARGKLEALLGRSEIACVVQDPTE